MFISHSQDYIGIIKYLSHYGVGVHRGQDVTNRRWGRSWLLTGSASLFKRINQSRPTARETARCEAACYLHIIARLDPLLGIEPDLLSRLHDASARYDFEQVARYISDDILRRVAFAGTPDEVAAQAAHWFDAGVQRVEFGPPHGLCPAEGLRLLGEVMLPAPP